MHLCMQASIEPLGRAGKRASGYCKITGRLWRPARAQAACWRVPNGTENASVCMCYRITVCVLEWEVMWPWVCGISLQFLSANWAQGQRVFLQETQSTSSNQAYEHGGACCGGCWKSHLMLKSLKVKVVFSTVYKGASILLSRILLTPPPQNHRLLGGGQSYA